MYPGAGRTGDRLVLVFGDIWFVIQSMLDVEAARRAPENEICHHTTSARPPAVQEKAPRASGASSLEEFYDVLRAEKVRNIIPDPAMARIWYQRAAQLGSADATSPQSMGKLISSGK